MNLGKILQKKYIFILFILFCTFFISGATYSTTPDTDPESTFTPKPYFDPINAAPIKAGVQISGGFKYQPALNTHLSYGNQITLHVQSVRSLLSIIMNPAESLTYTWVKYDGATWKKIPDVHGPDLIINANDSDKLQDIHSPGTNWYQVKAHYHTRVIPENFNSKIAAVHFLKTPIKATDLSITVDSNYLYNKKSDFDNSSLTPTATLTPSAATGTIKWEISDPTLATINPNTGEITANSNQKDGSFFIKATVTNNDGSQISKTLLMNVGGGLFDQKVRAGEDATFNIQGFNASNRSDSDLLVTWYKVDHILKKTTQVSQGFNQFSYTIKNTSEKDNDDHYFAEIVMFPNDKIKRKKITTSTGLLTVLPSIDSLITLTNTISNTSITDKTDNDNSSLNDITNNDPIKYKMTLKNDDNQDLDSTTLHLYTYLNTKISQITINDKKIPETHWKIVPSEKNLNQLVQINVGALPANSKLNVVIDTITPKITEQRKFASTPYFVAADPQDNHWQAIGSELILNYITDKLAIHVNDIVFDPIVNFQGAMIKHRTDASNAPNDIVYIDDQRKKKHPLKIMLQQDGHLTNENKLVLDASLMLHKPDSAPVPITSPQEVTNSVQDEPLKSVAWKRDEGLLLHVKGGYMPAGQYHTTLTWCIKDAP